MKRRTQLLAERRKKRLARKYSNNYRGMWKRASPQQLERLRRTLQTMADMGQIPTGNIADDDYVIIGRSQP